MRSGIGLAIVFAGVLSISSSEVVGEDPPAAPGARLNNLKVLSDKIEDVTTVDNILKSFVKPGMSDAERAKAIWTAAVKYRHQTAPPNEFLAADWEAHDPVKIFNVYGYCMCCCCSSIIEALNRIDGREAQGRILNGHSVPEVKYGDAWHMYDCSLITMFPKPGSGAIASVDEISEAVKSWHAKNPDAKGKIADIMRSDGWTGWKSKGPELLANCPYYNLGWFPARTHGWDATMSEYDRKCEVYEYGYQVGHRALFSLRPGESIVREAGHRNLHVNMDSAPGWDGLKAKVPENDLVYVKEFFPGYNGGLVANGHHRYAPDLAGGALAAGAELYDNLATGGSPALHVKNSGKPGVAVIQLASPYIYLGGTLSLKATRKTDADRIAVSISTNNGRTFAPLWTAGKVGSNEATVDLKERIYRRYAYLLKVEINSTNADGTGLELLSVDNDIQHAPRTLPWLGKGTNTITVATDGDSTLACRTITGMITADPGFNKNESTLTQGVVFDNLDVKEGNCWWKGGVGRMTVPIETGGNLVKLGFSTQFRARSDRDLIKVLLSFDDGQSWKEATRLTGPTPGKTEYTRIAELPAGVKKALLRYEMTGNNTVGVLSFRIDADYQDPRAGKSVRPFDVIYRWKENGQEKTSKTTIDKLPFSYKIDAAAVPEMVSVTYEMGGK